MTYIENPKGHIVFDCDGTLISSVHALYEGVCFVMSKILGREVAMQEAYDKYDSDVYQLALNFGLDPKKDETLKIKMIEIWKDFAQEHATPFRLFPGIKELILHLTANDYQLYVWTARDRRSTLQILKELGVAKFFLEFNCLDDQNDPKPNPAGLKKMLGDIEKQQILVIGDSPSDIKGAHNFGVAGVAACWASQNIESQLSAYGPEGLAKVPMDCVKIIEKLIR